MTLTKLERESKKFYPQYKNKLSKNYFSKDLNIHFSAFKIKIIQKGNKNVERISYNNNPVSA